METMKVSDYLKLQKGSGKRVKHGSPEHDEQVALFKYAELKGQQDIRWQMLFAIPNGAYFGTGKMGGMWAIAKKQRAEGLKSGVPDVFLPIPAGKFHGLFIEMKSGKNTLSENQKWWKDCLGIAGYFVNVCYSSDEAIYTIEEYLKLAKDSK